MFRQKNADYETSIKALTPEGVEFILSPAGLPVRTAAYAIDSTIQGTLIIAIYIAAHSLLGYLGVWIQFILFFLINWFYHVFFELAFKGQSPGKRLMGIRVVKSDGSPVDPSSSILRNFLRFADTFFSLNLIAFVSMSASSGFRRIGDWAGGTLVVYSLMAKNTPRNTLSALLEKYEPVTPSRLLSYEEKQAVMNFARRYSLLGEARANEIAGIYASCLKKESGNYGNLSNAAYLLGIARKLSGEM